MKTHSQNVSRRARGFTIIEVLVAIIIGMLSMLAVYEVFLQSAKTQRALTTVDELQTAGLNSLFTIDELVSNAGSGLMNPAVFNVLIHCPDPNPVESNLDNNIFATPDAQDMSDQLSIRPIPVVIANTDQGTGGQSAIFDKIYFISSAPGIYSVIPPGKKPELKEGLGDTTPGATFGALPFPIKVGLFFVAYDSASGVCGNYYLSISTNGVPSYFGTADISKPTDEVNVGHISRYRLHVVFNQGIGTLMLDSFTPDLNSSWTTFTPEWLKTSTPLISNVVAFVAMYGVDTDDDGKVDRWERPNSGSTWDPQNMRQAGLSGIQTTVQDIKNIKAIRVGIIARTSDPQKADDNTPQQPELSLFSDCDADSCDDAAPFKFTPPSPSDSGGLVYKYRKFETIIPLRNVVWNGQGQ
jgi:type IV pilus assembly protein PilW